MLHGASRESLSRVRVRLAELTRDDSADLQRVGDELFAVLGLLYEQPVLRRTLSDPARSADARAGLLRSLFSGEVSGPALDLAAAVVEERWTSAAALSAALEAVAAEAVVASAERQGRLDDVEDELFRFLRIVEATPPLRNALSDPAAPAESKERLLQSLLGGKAAPATERLVRQAAVARRGRTIEAVLQDYGQIAADRRNRLVARVRTAVPLTEEERARLGAALRRIYGHDVHLDIDLDPSVLGGVEVSVEGEVVDGTVRSRLDETRRRLAG